MTDLTNATTTIDINWISDTTNTITTTADIDCWMYDDTTNTNTITAINTNQIYDTTKIADLAKTNDDWMVTADIATTNGAFTSFIDTTGPQSQPWGLANIITELKADIKKSKIDKEEFYKLFQEHENEMIILSDNKVEKYELYNLTNRVSEVESLLNCLDSKVDKYDFCVLENYVNELPDRRDYNALSNSIRLNTYKDEQSFEILLKRIEELENKLNKKQENRFKTMKMLNMEFGPVNSEKVRMSPFGLAIRNAKGTWVSYDATKDAVVDVEAFNFDSSNFLYMVPVAMSEIKPKDIIVHNGKPCFVEQCYNSSIKVNDIFEGEIKEIKPTTNMFGFNYMTKVVCLLDFGTPSAENPFGNMWMLALADEVEDINPMMAMMMFNQQDKNMMNNPMMMALLMNESKNNNDMLTTMLAMNMMQNQPMHTPTGEPTTCCGNCTNTEECEDTEEN